MLSVESSVAIDTPDPATNVKVSVEESAETVACPDTAIFLNTSSVVPLVPVLVIVTVSEEASVVIAIPVPPAKFKVSEAWSIVISS